MKITNEMVEYAYDIAKLVYGGILSRTEGKKKIHEDTGMKEGSANDYITVFLEMMAGNEYHRTINNYATRYYLLNIRRDFGEEAFKRAVEATDMHTKYYSTLGKGNLRGIEKIVREFKTI